jgi:hypothetical protein
MKHLRTSLSNPLTLTAAFLIASSAALMIVTGPPGFWVEGWSLMDKAFWDEIPTAYQRGAVEMARPMYTTYVITAMKLLDYNSVALFGASLGLLATSALLMGMALRWAFPGRDGFVTASVVIAFFLPTTSLMVFMVHADNTRLVMVFFWLTVLLCQRWAVAPRPLELPAIPVLLMTMGLLTYESTIGTLLVIPLFVAPVYLRHNANRWIAYHILMLTQLLMTIGIGIGLYFYIRFLYGFSFGGDGIPVERDPMTLLSQLGAYLWTLPGYLWIHFRVFPYAPTAMLVGGLLGGVTVGVLAWSTRRTTPAERRWTEHPLYIIACGMGVILASLLPFIVTGRAPQLSLYEVDMRNFAASGYGLAILMGLLLTLPGRLRFAGIGVIAIFVGLWAGLLAHDGLDRRAAYELRQNMHTSLAGAAPGMQSETLVLILGDELNVGDFGVTYFRLGILDYIRMFYQDFSVYAYGVEPAGPGSRSNPVIVGNDGVSSEDSPPLASDQIVLLTLNRDGNLELTDCITPDDEWTIIWEDGVKQLCSATDRIVQPEHRSRLWNILGIEG